jgi:hypothetical protein
VSLNRVEQALHDYVERHPEERQYLWNKVRSVSASAEDPFAAVSRLDAQLWDYYRERSGVVPAFREAAATYGLRRTSMKNLAELWVRLWTDPKPRKKPETL